MWIACPRWLFATANPQALAGHLVIVSPFLGPLLIEAAEALPERRHRLRLSQTRPKVESITTSLSM